MFCFIIILIIICTIIIPTNPTKDCIVFSTGIDLGMGLHIIMLLVDPDWELDLGIYVGLCLYCVNAAASSSSAK